jgi:hypothetical protein
MGWGTGPVGAAAAGWSVALVGSYELLMVIRGSQAAPGGITDNADNPDPLVSRQPRYPPDEGHWDACAGIAAGTGWSSGSMARVMR